MSRQARFSLTALALIAAAGALAIAAGRSAIAVPAPRLEAIPNVIAGWSAVDHLPSAVLPPDAAASLRLSRTYERGGRSVWIAVDYYPDQSENRRPAARQLLFPGHGWADLREEVVHIPLDDPHGARLAANLILMRTPEHRTAVLYWYQLRRQSIASDHWYRIRLIWNRVTQGRSEGALVRVALPAPEPQSARDVVAEIGPLLRAFHADLAAVLPR